MLDQEKQMQISSSLSQKMKIISVINHTQVRYQLNLQLQHQKTISALAISPCDKFIASGDYGGLVKMWGIEKTQVSQFKFQFQSQGEENCVQCLLFSHDTQVLAAAIQYKTILIFKLDNQEFLPFAQLQEPECKIDSLAMTLDSFYLISGCFDTIQVWNIWQVKIVNTYPFKKGVNQITVSKNQVYLGCYCWKERLAYLFDFSNVSNLQKLIEWEIQESPCCIQFIKDCSQIIISGNQGVFVWKIEELLKSQLAKPLIIFKYNSYYSNVTNDGSLLFCRQSKEFNIIEYNTQKMIQTIKLNEDKENSLYKYIQVSPTMKYVIANEDKTISIFMKN